MDSIVLSHFSVWPTLLCFSALSAILFLVTSFSRKTQPTSLLPQLAKTQAIEECDRYPPVEPLPNFEWKNVEPVKIRPFKPKYNLTMSIQEATVSELIEMDRNYLDRITLRKSIMAQYPDNVLAGDESAKPAVQEFYIWLVGTYLPTRYPRMFQLVRSGKEDLDSEFTHLHNIPTDEKIPLSPPDHPIDALRVLGGLVEDDFLFLLPSDDGDSYTLKAFVTCFPNGFNTASKFNLKLRDIHKPVPHYKEKLENSMDRYFAKLKVGKFVKRANWAIQSSDQLFRPMGNHLYEGEEIPEEKFDIHNMRIRVERQYLHRLPQSKALMFSFKTLLYTIPEVKSEGLGESLIEAIDGLKNGNAPGFHLYKRAAVWGDFVKEYLRSSD